MNCTCKKKSCASCIAQEHAEKVYRFALLDEHVTNAIGAAQIAVQCFRRAEHVCRDEMIRKALATLIGDLCGAMLRFEQAVSARSEILEANGEQIL